MQDKGMIAWENDFIPFSTIPLSLDFLRWRLTRLAIGGEKINAVRWHGERGGG